MQKGNSNLEHDFTILLSLSVSLNNILHLQRYADNCLTILESHIEQKLQKSSLATKESISPLLASGCLSTMVSYSTLAK